MSLSFFAEHLREYFKQQQNQFFNKCSLIAFKLNNNPLLEIGLTNSKIIGDQIYAEIKVIKQDSCVKLVYYFRERFELCATSPDTITRVPLYKYCEVVFPEMLASFEKVEGKFFIFIIIEYKPNIIREFGRKSVNIHAFNISKILRRFFYNVKTYISHSCNNNTINLLALNHGIYASYNLNTHNNNKNNNLCEEIHFTPFKSHSSVKEFINHARSEIPSVNGDFNNLIKMLYFTAQKNRFYKYLREEYVVLMEYLLYKNFDVDSKIRLGAETEQWDAVIESKDCEEIIEITQALPDKEHKTRQALVETIHGYRGFSLNLRTIHQQGIDSFPKPIIDAIEKKHLKNYAMPRVLIVVVLAEFAYNEEFIVQEWIKQLNKTTKIGNFKKIYIAIDARHFYELDLTIKA